MLVSWSAVRRRKTTETARTVDRTEKFLLTPLFGSNIGVVRLENYTAETLVIKRIQQFDLSLIAVSLRECEAKPQYKLH